MDFFKRRGKKPDKSNQPVPRPTQPMQFQSAEPTGNIFREFWWIFVLIGISAIAMLAVAHWDEIASIISH